MIITVRCFFIPADITFDTEDIVLEVHTDYLTTLYFKGAEGSKIDIDKQHYLDEKNKK